MPFDPGGTVNDWVLVNGMAWLQGQGEFSRARECCRAIGPVEDQEILEGGTAFPAALMVRVRAPDGTAYNICSVSGTTNALQWVFHFLLSPPLNAEPLGGYSHQYFLISGAKVADKFGEFISRVPKGPKVRNILVGHSLGGASAQAAAAYLVKAGYDVDGVFASASPAVGSKDFNDYFSAVTYRLVTDGDPVPSLPPRVNPGTADWFGIPLALGPWRQFAEAGTGQTLHPDGTITAGTTAMGGLAAANIIRKDQGEAHRSFTYVERLGKPFLTQANLTRGVDGYDNPYYLAKQLGGLLGAYPDPDLPPPHVPQPPPPPIPEVVKENFPAVPPGSRGPAPRHPPLPLPPSSKGAFMGAPATPLPALAYRILFRFNMGAWGWTEEYILSYATPSFAVAIADAANLARMRRAVLNSDASIFGYRVQEWGVDPPRGSQFISDSALGCGPGEVDDVLAVSLSTEPVWDTALVSLWDDTRQYRRPLFIRGVPSQYVVWKVSGDAGLTAEGEAPMKDFLAKLLTRDPNAGLKGTLAIYGRSRALADTGEQRVESAAVNPRCGTDIVTNQEPAWAPGDTVHIHQAGCDQCHVPGMAGDTCVLDTNLNTPDNTFTTTIARRPCCCGAPINLPTDTVIGTVVKRFYGLTTGSIGRLTSRATGAGSGAGRGRARSCRG